MLQQSCDFLITVSVNNLAFLYQQRQINDKFHFFCTKPYITTIDIDTTISLCNL